MKQLFVKECQRMKNSLRETLNSDLKSSLVVFLVALPLCLGIAAASGAPPMAGLIAGIMGGLVVGLFFVVKTNFHRSVMVTERNGNYLVKLQKDVSFLNKAILIQELSQIPEGSKVIINATMAKFIDYDIQEVVNDFISTAHAKDITLVIEGYTHHLNEA